MDDIKKTALKRVLFVLSSVIISGYYSLNSYLLSGDLFVWSAYIIVIIALGFLTYFGTIFVIKDIRRFESLTAFDYFEKHKKRIKYFLIFSVIVLIGYLVFCDYYFDYLDPMFLFLMVFIYIILISALILFWYLNVKKIVREKQEKSKNK
jgi:hypothetical protein